MADKIDVLRDEITNDPLGRNYASMSNEEVVASGRVVNRTLPILALSSARVYEAVDAIEFAALSADQKVLMRDLYSLGDGISFAEGGKARDLMMSLFTGGSNTRNAMIAATQRNVGRWTELGISPVKVGHVQEARI